MMEKSCHSSVSGGGGESTATSTAASTSSSSSSRINNNNRDQYLNHLNKISHKISKPTPPVRGKAPTFDHFQQISKPQPQPPPENLQQQHQPPVYNINKSDFRDVVQKLTGSPAHERFSTPPPINQPKPPSSRLQRIRPPPLAQVNNRPPPLINCGLQPQAPANLALNHSNFISTAAGTGGNFNGGQRQPLSPLPPFPAVHAAAESPISAYMRYLQSSISTIESNHKQYSGVSTLAPVVTPRWNNPTQPLPPQALLQQQNIPPPPTSSSMPQSQFSAAASSPLPFGCFPSPRSPYPLLSPSLLLSPTGQLGFQQLPPSPTLPVPSPRWKGV